MNEWLVDGAPRTLREACQFLAWFQSVDRMWASGGALGQLDELLRPFYEARPGGRASSTTTRRCWHIASLLFNDTHYSQIGGPAPDGHDLTSRMSFLILEAVHRLRIPANLAMRVHERLDPELLRTAPSTYLFEDGTGRELFLLRAAWTRATRATACRCQLARMRAKVGCNWTALPGIEYCLQDVTRLCLVAPFLHAFDEWWPTPQRPRTHGRAVGALRRITWRSRST